MFRFFKTGKEERKITKDELEQAMAKFLETNANIVYTVLVNDDYTVNYDLLKPYLPAFPQTFFLLRRKRLRYLNIQKKI
ncbi:Peptidase M15B and M15C DD-carboxypeptidase VanY/endolysin [Bacillus cereus]|nr:Peptidase M15B and M15C DD-carboxypeptidase VanY/endolysin [Bacillus cereus]